MPAKQIKLPNRVTAQSTSYAAPNGFKKIMREPDLQKICDDLNKKLPNQRLISHILSRETEESPRPSQSSKQSTHANKKTQEPAQSAFKITVPVAIPTKYECQVEYFGNIVK